MLLLSYTAIAQNNGEQAVHVYKYSLTVEPINTLQIEQSMIQFRQLKYINNCTYDKNLSTFILYSDTLNKTQQPDIKSVIENQRLIPIKYEKVSLTKENSFKLPILKDTGPNPDHKFKKSHKI